MQLDTVRSLKRGKFKLKDLLFAAIFVVLAGLIIIPASGMAASQMSESESWSLAAGIPEDYLIDDEDSCTSAAENVGYHVEFIQTSQASLKSGPASAPPAPTLLSPADEDFVAGTSITFSWEAAEGAENYQLRIVRQSDGTVFYNQFVGNTTSYSISNFSDDGERYCWEVRAGSTEGWSDWSDNNCFTNQADPDPTVPPEPKPIFPTDGSYVAGTSITFEWEPSPGATYYIINVWRPDMYMQFCFEEVHSGTTHTCSEFPNDGTEFEWMVAAANEHGVSYYAYGGSFINGEEADPGDNTLGALEVGDKVVDPSWEWDHRIGSNYSGRVDETKPLTWIVVAKDHYGAQSGVTLYSEEVIALHGFDNSSRAGVDQFGRHFGSSHWGDSGTPDADYGLRPWLNSFGIHSGEGFYNAFSSTFQAALVPVSIPNRDIDGTEYFTQDKVYIPSTIEIGGTERFDIYNERVTWPIGTVFSFFSEQIGNSSNDLRVANWRGDPSPAYWTRTPSGVTSEIRDKNLETVGSDGSLATANDALNIWIGVRPAVNLRSSTPVSATPNAEGVYEIGHDPATTTWSNIATADARALAYDGGILAASVDGYGIALYNGEWVNLTSATALALATDGSTLVASVEGFGIWAYDGGWSQLTPFTADLLAVDNGMLAASFADHGIWLFDGNTWANLTPAPARALAFDGGRLVASVEGFGTWLNDGISWTQLTAETAQHLAISGGNIAASFSGLGIWYSDDGHTWDNLTAVPARSLALSNGVLAASVDGFGTWLNDGEWSNILDAPADLLALDGDKVAASFAGQGIWLYE